MKIWMSENTKNNNNYALRNIVLPLVPALLAVLLVIGSAFLSIYIGDDSGITLVVTYIIIVISIVLFASHAGKATVRDTLIFCQDDNDKLFVINATDYARGGIGIVGSTRKAIETQKVLNNLKQNHGLERYMSGEKSLHRLETQILSVEKLKTINDGHVAVCNVRFKNGNTGKRTYTIYNGYENESELIWALERKRNTGFPPEIKPNLYPIKIAVSVFMLIACIALCILSNPLTGTLPFPIFFLCVWGSFFFLFLTIRFCTKQKREE